MLPEISLNILDISQNSISAKATQIKIMVWVNTFKQQIKVQIKDNGTGMDAETVKRVTDPFLYYKDYSESRTRNSVF